jgi:hypothetical protein
MGQAFIVLWCAVIAVLVLLGMAYLAEESEAATTVVGLFLLFGTMAAQQIWEGRRDERERKAREEGRASARDERKRRRERGLGGDL